MVDYRPFWKSYGVCLVLVVIGAWVLSGITAAVIFLGSGLFVMVVLALALGFGEMARMGGAADEEPPTERPSKPE